MKLKFGITLGLLMLAAGSPSAQTASPTEYEIKAAFLYNFAKFVEWPPDAFKNSGGSFVIGVLGEDPFEKGLEKELTGKPLQDKQLVFKRLSSLDDALGCQVVFISASEEERLGAILNRLQGSPILTVSDMGKFIQHGGMVGFILQDNKVGFNVNRTVAESAGLKISSQLLKLAKIIVKTITWKSLG
jgi:hypothetical protein